MKSRLDQCPQPQLIRIGIAATLVGITGSIMLWGYAIGSLLLAPDNPALIALLIISSVGAYFSALAFGLGVGLMHGVHDPD